jgi:hypothetical protein
MKTTTRHTLIARTLYTVGIGWTFMKTAQVTPSDLNVTVVAWLVGFATLIAYLAS